jgi:peptide deformylase
MIRPIIRGPDPRLNMVSAQWDPSQMHVAQDLVDTWRDMIKGSASDPYGLSAPQIGHLFRVIIVKNTIMVNPVILEASPYKDKEVEGCLSFPWLKVKIERSVAGEISYFGEGMEQHTVSVSGMHFRVIQHEIDHLDGITLEQRRRTAPVAESPK